MMIHHSPIFLTHLVVKIQAIVPIITDKKLKQASSWKAIQKRQLLAIKLSQQNTGISPSIDGIRLSWIPVGEAAELAGGKGLWRQGLCCMNPNGLSLGLLLNLGHQKLLLLLSKKALLLFTFI